MRIRFGALLVSMSQISFGIDDCRIKSSCVDGWSVESETSLTSFEVGTKAARCQVCLDFCQYPYTNRKVEFARQDETSHIDIS